MSSMRLKNGSQSSDKLVMCAPSSETPLLLKSGALFWPTRSQFIVSCTRFYAVRVRFDDFNATALCCSFAGHKMNVISVDATDRCYHSMYWYAAPQTEAINNSHDTAVVSIRHSNGSSSSRNSFSALCSYSLMTELCHVVGMQQCHCYRYQTKIRLHSST